jgi:hypothetical protein
MKIRQNVRHWAAKKALTMPVLGNYAREKLVALHTGVFLDRADEDHREARRAHLDDFFDATMDTYVAALDAGFTEIMEFPADEIETHYERYADFFERHGITIDDPLGQFRPMTGSPRPPDTREARRARTPPPRGWLRRRRLRRDRRRRAGRRRSRRTR